jgi:hypothetical protein
MLEKPRIREKCVLIPVNGLGSLLNPRSQFTEARIPVFNFGQDTNQFRYLLTTALLSPPSTLLILQLQFQSIILHRTTLRSFRLHCQRHQEMALQVSSEA